MNRIKALNKMLVLAVLSVIFSVLLSGPIGRGAAWASQEGAWLYHQFTLSGPMVLSAGTGGYGSGLNVAAGGITGPAPATQVLVAGSTITVTCGAVNPINIATAVTLNGAASFTPASINSLAPATCSADIVNIASNTLTIPAAPTQQLLNGATAAFALTSSNTIHVELVGGVWFGK